MAEHVIIGCDPSTKKIALVWVYNGDTQNPHTWLYKLPDTQDYAQRCGAAYVAVRRQLQRIVQGRPNIEVYFFIEEPVVGRGGAYATITQAKIHGAIVAACHASTVVTRARGVNNATAKKQVVGKGNAGKPEIAQWCKVYWRSLAEKVSEYNKGDQQDIIDAGMIEQFGEKTISTKERLLNYRNTKRRIIKKRRSL